VTVLLVTEEADLAADLVVLGLRRRGASFVRFNTDNFPATARVTWDPLARTGVFEIGGTRIDASAIETAWFRAPHWTTRTDTYVDRESRTFLACCWEESPWRWINRPTAVRAAENKLRQLRVAAEIGFEVPDTVVSNDLVQVRQTLSTPMVAKALAGSITTVDGIPNYVHAQLVDEAVLTDEAVAAAPCIFQLLAKPATDLRITVVGSEVFATEIALERPLPIDWRAAPEDEVSYRPVALPDDVARRCVAMCDSLHLSYGAFDFVRSDSGRYMFLEVNPSGQWGWIEHATGQPITDALVNLLIGWDG
jgi:glutathione synthase/RimK-type ligase-like ATP-grasp enzyme